MRHYNVPLSILGRFNSTAHSQYIELVTSVLKAGKPVALIYSTGGHLKRILWNVLIPPD